jgi:uncharacterized protein with HEPN domain
MLDEDRVRILHMIDAADSLAQFVAGRKRADLDADRMLLFAMIRAIEVVGEAASRVTDETKASTLNIPWTAIVGMRNRLIHGYFDIDTRYCVENRDRRNPRIVTRPQSHPVAGARCQRWHHPVVVAVSH